MSHLASNINYKKFEEIMKMIQIYKRNEFGAVQELNRDHSQTKRVSYLYTNEKLP